MLQDKTHQRDEAMLRLLGLLGYPELVAAAVQVGSLGCRDGVVASYALQSVGNLAMENGNRQRFADIGGIELVVESMLAHMSEGSGGGSGAGGGGSGSGSGSGGGGGRVQKDAIVALRHLAYENDASKRRVLEAGGVEAVVTAMTTFGDNAQVQRQACGAVAVFAVHSSLGDAPRARVVAAGGLGAIMSAIRRWPGDGALVQQGLKALTSLLASPEAKAAAKEAGVVRLVEEIAARERPPINLAQGSVGGSELGEALRALLRKVENSAGAGGGGAAAKAK